MSARGAAALLAALTASVGVCGCAVLVKDRPASREPVRYSAQSVDGAPVSTVALRGRPAILSSWASWCTACREELPKLERLYRQRSRDGLQIVAVDLDSDGFSRAARGVAAQYRLTMPIWSDMSNDFSNRFRAVGVPTSVLLDRHGRLVRTWQGGIDPTDPATRRLVDRLLAQPSSRS